MKQVLVALLVLLVALSACTGVQKAKPIGDEGFGTVELDACAEVTCGDNALCKDGVCACQEGFKECSLGEDTTCIPEDSCCDASDCGENEVCTSGTCSFSCDTVTCPFNKLCFERSEGCFCPENTKWCDLQEKCIPTDNCCGKFDCGRDQSCTKTIESGKLCLYGNEKICKFVGITTKDFSLDGEVYTIGGKQFYYNDNVILQINEEEIDMKPGDNYTLPNGMIVQLQKLKTTGGYCQDKDVDRDEQT
ncbi:MAG: hypothetical protein ACE5FT_03805 [Candidatus Nanoarchaeia archaeon]